MTDVDEQPAKLDSIPPLEDEPRRHPFLWGLALLFLFLSVPFYYPSDREATLIAGLPDWCWITLLADFCFAATVACLILFTWKEPGSGERPENGNSRGS